MFAECKEFQVFQFLENPNSILQYPMFIEYLHISKSINTVIASMERSESRPATQNNNRKI